MTRQTLPQNYRTIAPTRLVKFSAHGATSTQFGSCTQSVDTSIYRVEDSTLKVTADNDGFAEARFYYAAGLSFNDTDGIALSFYIPDVGTSVSALALKFSYSNSAASISTPADRSTTTLRFYGVRRGWNYVRIRFDTTGVAPLEGPFLSETWTASGSGAVPTSSVNWFRVELYVASGKPVYLEGLYRGGRSRPKLVWIFDEWDSTIGGYVNPIFSEYGWNWGIAVPDIYMATTLLSSIETARTAGAQMMLNDVADRNLVTSGLSRGEVTTMVRQNIGRFRSRGWTECINIFTLNNNAHNDDIVDGMRDAGIRIIGCGQNEQWITCTEQGLPDGCRLGRRSIDNMVFSNSKKYIDRLVQYGASAWLYQHGIDAGGTVGGSAAPPGGDGLGTYYEDFVALAAYVRRLQVAGVIDVVGPTEWLKGMSQPRIIS